MTWHKDRKLTSGELEFHLVGDQGTKRHDDAWEHRRLEKLQRRHAAHDEARP